MRRPALGQRELQPADRPGSLVLNAARTIEPDRDYAVTAAYAVSLGPTTSVTATGRTSNNSDRARLQYNRTRGASELGLDYRVATEIGDDNRPIDARVGYQTSYFGTDADIERFSGDNRFRLGVNGSAAVVDGNFGLTRRIGRSFGLVDLPGFPNVRVYLDNREAGTTDASGKLMLPNLRPYEPNRIRLADRGPAAVGRSGYGRNRRRALWTQWHDHRFRHHRCPARDRDIARWRGQTTARRPDPFERRRGPRGDGRPRRLHPAHWSARRPGLSRRASTAAAASFVPCRRSPPTTRSRISERYDAPTDRPWPRTRPLLDCHARASRLPGPMPSRSPSASSTSGNGLTAPARSR
jgi:hypothetical protein